MLKIQMLGHRINLANNPIGNAKRRKIDLFGSTLNKRRHLATPTCQLPYSLFGRLAMRRVLLRTSRRNIPDRWTRKRNQRILFIEAQHNVSSFHNTRLTINALPPPSSRKANTEVFAQDCISHCQLPSRARGKGRILSSLFGPPLSVTLFWSFFPWMPP